MAIALHGTFTLTNACDNPKQVPCSHRSLYRANAHIDKGSDSLISRVDVEPSGHCTSQLLPPHTTYAMLRTRLQLHARQRTVHSKLPHESSMYLLVHHSSANRPIAAHPSYTIAPRAACLTASRQADARPVRDHLPRRLHAWLFHSCICPFEISVNLAAQPVITALAARTSLVVTPP